MMKKAIDFDVTTDRIKSDEFILEKYKYLGGVDYQMF